MLIVWREKSTNSSGWEYLIVWEDLGSSLMYVVGVLFELFLFCFG